MSRTKFRYRVAGRLLGRRKNAGMQGRRIIVLKKNDRTIDRVMSQNCAVEMKRRKG